MRRGRFITLEGGEGAGKSTQSALLCAHLRERGIGVLATREPGGAPGAEEIRRLLVAGAVDRWQPLSEALLHYAARYEHLETTIIPALDIGHWVVSDRFADSSMVYQGLGQGLGEDRIVALHRAILGDFTPDLTIVLDIPVDVGLARAGARRAQGEGADDRYERMGAAFHQRLRDGFLKIAAAEPARCVVVDAALAPETVASAIFAAVTERLHP